ncbi:hypothetical protein FY526_23480, partial [Clostridioides difficile]
FFNYYSKELVYISNSDFTESYKVELGEYLKYVVSSAEDDDDILYLRDWSLQEHFDKVSRPASIVNIMDDIDSNRVPKMKWIYIGPIGSGTPLHQDTLSTHAWNGLLEGEKHWVFFSEEDTEYL